LQRNKWTLLTDLDQASRTPGFLRRASGRTFSFFGEKRLGLEVFWVEAYERDLERGTKAGGFS
jgi:hypothetical protein